MSPQLKSQSIGLALAISTALGVIAYERLVKSCTYFTVGSLVSLSYAPFFIASLAFQGRSGAEWSAITRNRWAVLVFLASGVTGPLWYAITRKQSALVGATYEVKYIVVMAVIYLFFGQTRVTWNTLIGVALALTSVYFISRS